MEDYFHFVRFFFCCCDVADEGDPGLPPDSLSRLQVDSRTRHRTEPVDVVLSLAGAVESGKRSLHVSRMIEPLAGKVERGQGLRSHLSNLVNTLGFAMPNMPAEIRRNVRDAVLTTLD